MDKDVWERRIERRICQWPIPEGKGEREKNGGRKKLKGRREG